ncbi:B12-binding domain-containing radical SAM protein [Candidatus Hecatella orcuttiae]|jgi:radical SAM superfamily enzyme YgiQ (UPF0313 family)|uniref:B12-binding domain-containing radical SAM protein n=1 Tax=Candidatus Hecatella orcuttiae TaxID=1935119 RepID=UPI002867C2D8|nr:radical SAM protein [Candidatus Hecatella orcuttiae]
MRVLLVQPPTPLEVETLSSIDMVAPSMGLAYLAAVLEQHGYAVEILDAPALQVTHEQLPRELERRKPDLVGVTATTAVIGSALKTAETAKAVLPEATVVLGGAHLTFTQETTMSLCPSVDVGVVGEGEYTLLELVQTLEKGGSLKDVKGIIYREDGRLVKTPPRPLIANLDELPFPARHLLPMDQYRAFGKKRILGTIFTSRGCPFSCIFCSSSLLFGKKFRARSPKNVVDEIEQFQREYNSKFVEIIDDIFILDRKRAEAICRELMERNLGTVWVCSARIDLMTKELMQMLRKAGCVMIYYGVESGVQRVVDLMKKGIKVDHAFKVIQWARELGMESVASFVVGIPGETWEEAVQTIKFAKKLNAEYAQFAIATPFPGTELYEMAKREGLLLTEDWSQYTVLKPVMRTRELSAEQLKKLIRKCYLEYYLRPRIMWNYIRRGHARELLVNVIGHYLWQAVKAGVKGLFKPAASTPPPVDSELRVKT